MNPAEARDFLRAACSTETGRAALRDLGFGTVAQAPDEGDDDSTVAVATALAGELARRYRFKPI
jgi:hypothetical protein